MAQGGSLRLTLIGRFTLWHGRRELEIATSSQRLIALLALRDRPAGRLHVAATLWPDSPTERALAGLRSALWRVNQASKHVIVATPSFLRLDDNIEVDVHELLAFARQLNQFEKPVDVGYAASVGVADLVSELLPDWCDDWLHDEREGLRQTRLHALEGLAWRFSECGRHADAIQAALAAIRLEPLRESAHRTLIEMHLAEGNRSEAWRQYHRCRELLQEELGIEPSDSMRLLLEPRPSAIRLPRAPIEALVPRARTATARNPSSRYSNTQI
jgi:DNA-binding SARP family transcriptional activator